MNNNYRAWDVEEERMYYNRAPYLYITNEGALKLDPQLKQDRYYFIEKELVITQSTGMLDILAREIFVGDIVQGQSRLQEDWTVKQEVIFHNGCFMFGNWNAHEYFNKHAEIMIIGNKFESPKLISK
jgi:hypothetical protein